MRPKAAAFLATIAATAVWSIEGLILPSSASAQQPPSPSPLPTPNDLPTTVNTLTQTIVGLLAGIATLFLTIGGVLYLIAAGDPEQVSKAKSALKSAAIGYAVAVLAPVLVTLLKKVVGVDK